MSTHKKSCQCRSVMDLRLINWRVRRWWTGERWWFSGYNRITLDTAPYITESHQKTCGQSRVDRWTWSNQKSISPTIGMDGMEVSTHEQSVIESVNQSNSTYLRQVIFSKSQFPKNVYNVQSGPTWVRRSEDGTFELCPVVGGNWRYMWLMQRYVNKCHQPFEGIRVPLPRAVAGALMRAAILEGWMGGGRSDYTNPEINNY